MLNSLKGPLDARAKFVLDKDSRKLAQFKIGREVIVGDPRGEYTALTAPKPRKSFRPWLAAPERMCSRFIDILHGEGLAETKRSP